MAKTLVPNYVQAALTADRTQQVNTLAALIVYLFGEQKANREVKELGATLHKAAPHRSEKTWQNYVSAARAVAERQTVKLESLWAADKEPGVVVPALVHWLTHELEKRKYTTSTDDVTRWAKGEPSLAAKKRADDKAEKEAQQQQAKANEEAAARQATQAAADKAAAEAKAAEEAARLTQKSQQGEEAGTGDEGGTDATGYSPAIEPPASDSAPAFMMNAARAPDGSIVITLADNLTRGDLLALALKLETMLETLPAEVKAEEPALV